MARISLDPPRSLTGRLVRAYCRRQWGEDLQPALAMLHHPRLLRTSLRYEQSLARWDRLDERLAQGDLGEVVMKAIAPELERHGHGLAAVAAAAADLPGILTSRYRPLCDQ